MGFEREINKPGYSTGQDVGPERIDQFRRGHHGFESDLVGLMVWQTQGYRNRQSNSTGLNV